MLPEGVLSIAIRDDYWQHPRKNERKAELIKYWHRRAALNRVNTWISKELHATMSQQLYTADDRAVHWLETAAKKALAKWKNGHLRAMRERPKFCRCVSSCSSSSSSIFFISTWFLRTIADTDIISTLLEPLRPTNAFFVGHKTN